MYTPPSFAESDLQVIHDFVDANGFGMIVTTRDGEIQASHLPFLLHRDTGPQGTLRSHMARANSQWQNGEGTDVMVIFAGPHAYISPAWYAARNVVPTWNYVAVHAYGKLRLVTESDQLLGIVRDTVDKHERSRAQPWSLDEPDADFIDGLLDAIVGFEIVVSRFEGKWKLSQNHDAARRERVVAELVARGSDGDVQMAKMMRRQLDTS